MQVVIQGAIYEGITDKVINNFLNTSFIKNVIVSCWETCQLPDLKDSRITYIQNKKPENVGNNHRNLQIVSSLAGILKVTSDVCIKTRSDYIISIESLEKINRFFNKFKEPQLKYLDGSGPKYQMFVFGDYYIYPFHPRDHFYMSDTESIKKLFNIPLCKYPPQPSMNCNHITRPETYIGSYYCSNFNDKVLEMVRNDRKYLCDDSPNRIEAMILSNQITGKVFRVLPRVDILMAKYGVPYSYEHHAMIEICHNETWE